MKKRVKLYLPLSTDKIMSCEVFPFNNFQRQQCSCICLKGMQFIFEIGAYLHILQRFQCITSSTDADWRKQANLEQERTAESPKRLH